VSGVGLEGLHHGGEQRLAIQRLARQGLLDVQDLVADLPGEGLVVPPQRPTEQIRRGRHASPDNA
jgi:hypothetical protein